MNRIRITLVLFTYTFILCLGRPLNANAQKDSFLFDLQKDKLPVIKFSGTATAELYSKEIEESFRGVLKYNFISEPIKDYPRGFVRASPVPQVMEYGILDPRWGNISKGTDPLGND